MRDATAAADPLLEPPGVWLGFQGLRVGAGSTLANSVVSVLPRRIAPACFRLAIAAASYPGLWPFSSAEPASVGMSAVQNISFAAKGTPCSGPLNIPRAASAPS